MTQKFTVATEVSTTTNIKLLTTTKVKLPTTEKLTMAKHMMANEQKFTMAHKFTITENSVLAKKNKTSLLKIMFFPMVKAMKNMHREEANWVWRLTATFMTTFRIKEAYWNHISVDCREQTKDFTMAAEILMKVNFTPMAIKTFTATTNPNLLQ